jgi:hypothetical protein
MDTEDTNPVPLPTTSARMQNHGLPPKKPRSVRKREFGELAPEINDSEEKR